MYVGLTQQAIHHLALDTVTEDAIKRMGDDGEAALRMHQFDAALDAQVGWDGFFQEERQHMPLARADFLVHDGRASDGRVLLESVLRDETGNGRALEIMGWLSLREHKFQEARQFCERAIQADDRSFLGHSCFALSSMQGTAPRTSPEQARIEQSLRTAIRVNASFAPAYAGLGEYLSFRAKYQEALSAARKAVQLEPGMVEFRNEEANILLRMNRVKEATDSLNFALKLAHAPEEVAAVEAVLHSATQINYHKRRTD